MVRVIEGSSYWESTVYPGNFKSEGKQKTVRVSGHSSYWGRLNSKFVIISSNY